MTQVLQRPRTGQSNECSGELEKGRQGSRVRMRARGERSSGMPLSECPVQEACPSQPFRGWLAGLHFGLDGAAKVNQVTGDHKNRFNGEDPAQTTKCRDPGPDTPKPVEVPTDHLTLSPLAGCYRGQVRGKMLSRHATQDITSVMISTLPG